MGEVVNTSDRSGVRHIDEVARGVQSTLLIHGGVLLLYRFFSCFLFFVRVDVRDMAWRFYPCLYDILFLAIGAFGFCTLLYCTGGSSVAGWSHE